MYNCISVSFFVVVCAQIISELTNLYRIVNGAGQLISEDNLPIVNSSRSLSRVGNLWYFSLTL